MINWKKYEMYIDDIFAGVLNVNKPIMKKAISLSVAGIIGVTTISGYFFYNQKQKISTTTIENPIEFDSIDSEISEKFNFIDDFLNDVTIEPLRNIILEPYQEARSIEFDLDSKNNEYAMFYTEEDINNKKQQIITKLDESINVIEQYSNKRFTEEYNDSKTK